MKLILTLALFLTIGSLLTLKAQIPDGSIAPNWTLTDIDGNTHTLYDYLAQGKMVILKFSATWCGPCWNYMQTGALETVWEEYGPGGENTVMIFYIEADFNTGMADLLGQTASSQGNWVEAIPFPIIDLQPGQNQASQYQIAYYPTLFSVCSDNTIWELGQVPASTWISYIQSCTLDGEVANVEHAPCSTEGSITVSYTGGVGPITYNWSNGANTATISNLAAGTYSVTITESGGKWVKLQNIQIVGPAQAMGVEQSNLEQPLCFGLANGSINIEIEGGTAGYEYEWSTGSTSEDLTNVPAGTYEVTVTDINGCILEEEFILPEPDQITVDMEITPENCDQEDGTITLDIEGGVGGYEITASNGDVFGNMIINLPQGFVTTTVEDNNGCIWEAEIEIEFIAAPEVEISQGNALNCVQSVTTLTGLAWSGSGDFEYEWWTVDGNIVGPVNQETITVDEEGTYHLIVIDFISDCETASSHLVIAEIVLPEVNAGEDLPISCETNVLTLNGNGDPSNTVTWTTTTGNIVSGGNTYNPVVNAPGEYMLTVVNPVNGCSNLDVVEVLDQVFPANAAFQYQTSSLTIATMDISTGSNVTGWAWTFGDGSTSNEQSPFYTYAAAGSYEVCLTVQNGCGPSQTCSQVEVTSSGSVLNVAGTVNHVLCHGDSTGSIALLVNGGSGVYTYVWTGPEGVVYNTADIQNLPAGAYVVVISDSEGNSTIAGYNVEQPEPITIGASSVVDNLCFQETNGSITVELTGGVGPFLYSWNGGSQQTESTISNLAAGTYEVLVTDANGCSLLVGPYTINEPDILQVTILELVDASGPSQSDGSITIGVTGGTEPYTVTWSNGATGTSITGLLPGQYSYTIVDANGCILASQEPVVINHLVSTTDHEASMYVSITPNPSNGKVFIEWKELTSEHSTLSLMTMDGRQIASHVITSAEGTWDLSSLELSEGLYIVILKQEQRVYPFKLVVF